MRYATSRQKSCQQCSKARARCDRHVDRCSRCTKRDLECIYHPTRIPKESTEYASEQPGLVSYESTPSSYGSIGSNAFLCSYNGASAVSLAHIDGPDGPGSTRLASETPPDHNFSLQVTDTELNLVCPINADDISNRWLNHFVPLPGQKIKTYPANVSSFIYRILKSYTTVVIRGHGVPPFIHRSQTAADTICQALSACISLVKICDGVLPGATATVTQVLQREMDSLYQQHSIFDTRQLLATFQAYLIYSMVLFFQLGHASNTFLRQAMTNLQLIACTSARHGLVCSAEQDGTHPEWEAWIMAESKRRTLYVMYLFDSLLSSQENLPTFLGAELSGLPAPNNKLLWQARFRGEWQKLYSKFLSEWADNPLRINELWPRAPELDALESAQQDARVEQWLENLDEYGSMLYAVTCCTHGV